MVYFRSFKFPALMVRGERAGGSPPPPVVEIFGQNAFDSGKRTWRKQEKKSQKLIKEVLIIKISGITTFFH